MSWYVQVEEGKEFDCLVYGTLLQATTQLLDPLIVVAHTQYHTIETETVCTYKARRMWCSFFGAFFAM